MSVDLLIIFQCIAKKEQNEKRSFDVAIGHSAFSETKICQHAPRPILV